MIHLTQIIYVQEGQEATFEAFEDRVLTLLGPHGGRLLLRLRPAPEALVAGELEPPYEVHLVAFDREEDYRAYNEDPLRQELLPLKIQSVRQALLYQGHSV